MKVNRREVKYLLDYYQYFRIKSILQRLLKIDEHNGFTGYKIRSLYFDTLDDADYFAKMDGENRRKKIRLRVYSPDDEKVKLELKSKEGIYQKKETVYISREDAKEVMRKNYGVLLKYDDDKALKIYNIMTFGYYVPVVVIEYQREAYIHKDNNIRITFDSKITSSEFDFRLLEENPSLIPIFDEEKIVLEVKFSGEIFNWLTDVLKNENLVNASLSKYCESRRVFANYLM